MPDGASHPLFPAVPRPAQAVAHPAWQAALAEIEASLGKAGLVAIVGAPGTGKTLLLCAVAERLHASGKVAALFQPTPVPGSRKPDVVLIDGVGRLTVSMLRALAQQARPVVVTGGLDLAERLRDAGVPAAVVTLGPLSPDEAAAFLRIQVAAAGRPADLIQPAAVMQLVERSQGVPRSLQMLAGLSVFVARLADAFQVTPAHVEQAALIQTGTEPGDDDGDADEDSLAIPAPTQSVSVELAPLELASLAPAPKPARPALPAASRQAQRGVGKWVMAALAMGALGSGAGIGWLLIPYASPRLLALAGTLSGPAAEQPASSHIVGEPRPAPPLAHPGPAAPQGSPSQAVAPLGPSLPPAVPRPAAPLANSQAQAAPAFQALRPAQPASGQPIPPSAAAVPPTVPDPDASRQPLVAAAPQPVPPVPAAPEPLPAPKSGQAPAPGRTSSALPQAPGQSAAAAQALPLPQVAPVHVTVFYDANNEDAGVQADSLAESLGKLGYQVPPPEPGAVRGEPAVSYAFAEDALAATALAHAIGLEATQVRPAAEPRPGTIRVTVVPAAAGRSSANPQATGNRR